MVEKTFSTMPYDNSELSCMLSFGKRVDHLSGLPTSPVTVVEMVFGNPVDVIFSLALQLPTTPADCCDDDDEFEVAEGYCLYALTPRPSLTTASVELGYGDGTMQANVPVVGGRFVASKRMPSFARVKSTARKTAFARLCAKPCIREFHERVLKAEMALRDLVATWNANAYNGFESILSIVKETSRHCPEVRKCRNSMCAQHVGGPMAGNVLVDAVLATAGCAETACPICISAAGNIKTHQQHLVDMTSGIFEVASGLHASFFTAYKSPPGAGDIDSDSDFHSASVAFSPPGCEEKTRVALRACLKDREKKAVRQPPLPLPLPPSLSLTPPSLSTALRICGLTSRATRLREVAGRGYRDTIAGHWNDACATASMCESLQESILGRLLVIVPDLDTAPILVAASCIDDFAKQAFLFTQDFRRCLRRCCANVETDMATLDVDCFLKLQCTCNALAGRLEKVSAAILLLCEAIESAAHFETALSRVLYTEREMTIKQHHLAEQRMHTFCPCNNIEYMLYSSDGTTSMRRSSLQHARFKRVGNRILCVDPSCLRSRGLKFDCDGDGADLSNRLNEPIQTYLERVGCVACQGKGPFSVAPAGDNVFCVACEARVHCPPTVVERHDDVNCPWPDAGVLTCLERGSVTCQGCGLVISDRVCIEGADERTFADDDASTNPCRHSAPASIHLSNGSNVTFISAPRGGVSVDGLVELKKYTRTHKRLNKYVPTDDMMRMTTWVKRDEHVKYFQDVLHEAMTADEIRITHTDKNLALQRFKNIRWYNEKMYGIRLVIFTLTASALLQARQRRLMLKTCKESVCATCGATIPFKDVAAHVRHCRPKPRDVPVQDPAKKRRRHALSVLSFDE